MKRLLILVVLGTLAISTAGWSLVVIDDGFEDYDVGECLAPGTTLGEPGLGAWEYAWGTDPVRAIVVSSPVSTGERGTKWQIPPGVFSPDANTVIWSRFPVEWTTGTVVAYFDCAMETYGGLPGGAEISTFKFFDDSPTPGPGGVISPNYHPQELTRIRYIKRNDGTSAFGIRGCSNTPGGINADVTIVNNPPAGSWHRIKIEFNLTTKKFKAFVGDGDRSGQNVGHWGRYVSGSLVLDGTPAADLFFARPARGLKYLWWTMWARGNEGFWAPSYIFADNIYVEGPSRHVPAFTSPGDTCGWSPQFRYFTQTPTFSWEVDPHSKYRVKVFDKATAEAAGFNPETDTAVWDSGDVTSTGNVCTVTSSLPESDLGNPPSNILYVFAKAWLDEFDNWGAWTHPGADFVCALGPPSVPSAPTFVSPTPVGVYTSVTPPQIAWNVSSGDWDQSQVVVTNDTLGTTYYDSAWQTGGSPIDLDQALYGDPPADLPDLINENTYTVQVRVRKGCIEGSAGYESGLSASTFTVYTSAPSAPIITNPVGSHPGLQPVVEFTGGPHSALQVKITSDSDGNSILWDTGVVQSPLFGANCPLTLVTGTTYYAFAKIENPIGWSPWSSASSFAVSRSGETVSVRHMDETGILTSRQAYPDDMFAVGVPAGFDETGITVSTPDCPTGVLRIVDSGEGGALRRHNAPINLDKGVTVVTAVRAAIPDGESDDPAEGWKSASIVVTDSAHRAGTAVKLRSAWDVNFNPVTEVSICVDGSTWSSAQVATLPTDFNVIRITGKAGVYNDPSSVVWKVYVNEALALTANGAISAAQFESGTGSWITAQILIGQGSAFLKGILEYDWTAVNCSGAYGPGDWNQALAVYSPGSSPRDWKLSGATYASVAEALAGETGFATISGGDMVINHVAADSFFVQDIDANAFSLKVDAATAVGNKGKKLNSVSGLLSFDGAIKRVKIPTPSIGTTSLAFSPVVLSMKALGGSPCITQLDGIAVNNVGKLVRVFGTLPVDPWDDMTQGAAGVQLFYVDDLSGTDWVADGRDGLPGVRFLVDLYTQTPVSLSAGDVVEVVGISSTQSYVDGEGNLVTVRKIESPVITKVGP